ncbi:MAG: biotin/lipoate A/B protein ligase family protein [Chloroflexota bacterium]
MSERWRCLIEDGVGAADGLATDDALLRHAPRQGTSLRLYTYRTHCALVGRFQNVEAELDLDACAETGTQVGRRPTGGGAIVMGRDQLGIALVTPVVPGAATHPRALLARYAQGVRGGLDSIGIRAELRGKNDLVVDGKKVAGLGIAVIPGAALFHCSLLVDLDVTFMLRVLRVPARALGAGATAAVVRRVTTVRREGGRNLSLEAVRGGVSEGFARAFGATLVPGSLDDAEREAARTLALERHAAPEWLFPPRLREERHGEGTVDTLLGTVHAAVTLSGDVIAAVLVSGDFVGSESAVGEFESSLRWTRPSRRILRERAMAVADAVGIRADDLADAVWQACVEARAAGRNTGACYYPAVADGVAEIAGGGR